jgi:hypothetical protein
MAKIPLIDDILRGKKMTDEEYSKLKSLFRYPFPLPGENPFEKEELLTTQYMFQNKRYPGLTFRTKRLLDRLDDSAICSVLICVFMGTCLLLLLLLRCYRDYQS